MCRCAVGDAEITCFDREWAALSGAYSTHQKMNVDERRVAVAGIARYVETKEECQRRASTLAPKSDRAEQERRWRDWGRICVTGSI